MRKEGRGAALGRPARLFKLVATGRGHGGRWRSFQAWCGSCWLAFIGILKFECLGAGRSPAPVGFLFIPLT